MRKVVELARALCTEPQLLLLDEPSSGLNVEETDDMAFWITDIKDELGITVLMVEHDMGLVSKVSDRVLAMSQGPGAGHRHARRGAEPPRCDRSLPGHGGRCVQPAPRKRKGDRMSVPTSDAPVLKLLNVESAYGPIKAIRGVSLQVRRGEIATVLGSNGAGKTTILKTISGIIDPRKGTVEFKGQDITAQDPAFIVQQGLSHVPEGREVFPLLSVRDNLLMGAYTRNDRDGVGARHGGGVQLLPHPARARRARRRPALRWAAADAGHQPRAHGQPRPDPAWTSPAWA